MNFDTYMESEGILYYEVNSQWWKVPAKKVKYHNDEVYDLRGAVKFEPTFIQRQLLGNDGWITDDGWEIILRHYQDSYGPAGHTQLLKDLASQGVGEAFAKFTAEQAPELILGLLFGEAAARIAKIASPALRKSYAALQKRLKALSKRSKKQTKTILEKELSEVADELRKLANRETDAVAKREAKEIADGLEDEYKKGSQQLGSSAPASRAGTAGAGTEGESPPSPAEAKGGKYRDVRQSNRGGEVHHTPAKSVSPYAHSDGPSVWMETADHRRTASWGSSKAAQAYRARQQELIKEGRTARCYPNGY